MERRKNLPVLPSNAPALSPRTSILSSQSEDLINPLSSQSSILRASSGDASGAPLESSIFDNKFKSDDRYEAKLTSASVNTPYHTAQAAIRLTQKKDRRNIWQRWEHHSPRYLAYRRKARSKKAGTKEDVWPDDVEEAFQIAIRLYAKRGRTKDELNGRQAGGNEFISDWIEKQTGHRRCRKQISSHIQTLKGFLGDVPAWMDLVTAWPAGKQEKAKVIKHIPTAYDELDLVGSNKLDSIRSMQHQGSLNPRLPSSANCSSNDIQDPTIRSIQFEIHLSKEAASNRTHVYTSIQSEIGTAPRMLEQVPQWQDLFPHLANRYNEGRIDCPLFLFESRLRLIDDIRPGLSLGVEFFMNFAEGAYFHDWRSFTRVQKRNITPQFFDGGGLEETWDHLECRELKSSHSDVQLVIPFKSKWWVRLFSSIIKKRDEAASAKDRDAIKWAEGYPAAYLRELSIMQELWATPRGGPSQRAQRMAILLWTFSQIRNGEAATTTWRPITLSTSASPYQIQEPNLRNMQPSMNLDSALSESMGSPQHGQQQVSDLYNSHGSHGGLLSETSEALLTTQLSECQSSPVTPILDYTSSFPSSTSASFPSSISNASGYYPSHHGSSFDSQASTNSSYSQSLESSLHSQPSVHDSNYVYGIRHPIVNHSMKSHDSSHTFPDSQELLYTSQPSSVYGSLSEYRSSSFDPRSSINDDTILVENPSQNRDFTGRALQYAYAGQQGATTEQEPSPTNGGGFQVPLIAPRANLLPVQQVGECLQSFEAWVPEQGHQSQESPQRVEGDNDEGEGVEELVCGNTLRQPVDYLQQHHHHHLYNQQTVFQSHPQLRSPFPAIYQNEEALQLQLQQQQPNESASNPTTTHPPPATTTTSANYDEDDDMDPDNSANTTLTAPTTANENYDDDEEEVGEADDDGDDEETQRQVQLQYLHDAQDQWQQSFHSSAIWSSVLGGVEGGEILDGVN